MAFEIYASIIESTT